MRPNAFRAVLVCLALFFQSVSADTDTPISITGFGTAVAQDFDSLAATSTSTATPPGWGFVESGTNANGTYTAGTGSANAGDTYSFGAAGVTERALGALRSGTLIPIFGARFTNNTGGTITSLAVSYTGEQWRSGTAARIDRIDFEISTNATSLTAGTYTPVDSLAFTTPNTVGTGPKDGNAAVNRTAVSHTITGLSIANGASFFIRWTDFDASGADDGLAVDDFSLTATGIVDEEDSAPAVTNTTPAYGAGNVAVASNIVINFSETVNAPAGAFSLVCGNSPQAFTASASPAGSFTLTPSSPLPFAAPCTVTVAADQVTDLDADDPPDHMAANFEVSFTTENPAPVQTSTAVVVSQIYGGGGNSGATFRNDYIELHNRSASIVNITGWSVQYASAAGTSWQMQLLNGTIAPGEYYLVALASGGGTGAVLPEANISGTINMSGTTGKVALVANFDGLSGACPLVDSDLIDFVGYGTAATCHEGAGNAPAPSNTTAVFRDDDGGSDTDNNDIDFLTGTPNPRRTAPIVAIETGPLVLSTEPRTEGTNAPRDATIRVTFSEPVDAVGTWFQIACVTTGQHTSVTFAGTAQDRYITPNDNFEPGEQCTVTIFKDQVSDQDLDDILPNTNTLPADYSWTFTVATGTAPPFPASVHLTMGNPTGATADVNQPGNYLMEKPEYALSYNRNLGRPNWVSWHLAEDWVGTLSRVDTFRPDPAVPPDWYRVQTFDFTGSGFDRGHMVPNADRDKETSIPINQATFLMSNMIAQAPDNNQGPWADLENDLRSLLPANAFHGANEIYVVAGGWGSGGTGSNGSAMTIAGGQVSVPAWTWKAALVIPADAGDDLSRVTCTARTIVVIMPNAQGIRNAAWQDYLTSVDAVEELTGYNLFSNLPAAVQRCVEAGVDGTNPINEPVFSALDAPTIEAGSASVAISGTLSVDGLVPPGSVTVSLAGMTENAAIGADGRFTATFPASALTVANSPYAIGFSYAGDVNFKSATGSSSLQVIDTTAPVISNVAATPDVLGPPNHKMIDVTISYATADVTGAVCSLSVSSNEAPFAYGDGNTAIDWQVIDAHRLRLRAERAGGGSGRIYSVTIRCTDSAGNTGLATTSVGVPK
jgi:DNA/RNA endonuclease G (NUC1)